MDITQQQVEDALAVGAYLAHQREQMLKQWHGVYPLYYVLRTDVPMDDSEVEPDEVGR